MKKTILKTKILFLLLFFALSGCETIDLEGLKNENETGLDLLDPVYAFNYLQVTLPKFIDSANSITQPLIRQMAMTSGKTYDNAFEPDDSNTNWRQAYTMLNTMKLLEPKAIQNKQYHLLGATKIIRAYILFTLVDLYGDVPYSDALMGNDNLNPKFDSGIDVYKKAFQELESAILLLDNTQNNITPENQAYDLYYGDTSLKKLNVTKWKALARSLKLRALVTARKNGTALGLNIASEITTLMSQDLIDTKPEDFVFKYSTDNTTSPSSSRHPDYESSYISTRSAPYISNYFLWTMVREKSTASTLPVQADFNLVDPRVNYYFYNQSSNVYNNDTFVLPGKFATRPDHYNAANYASFYRPNRLSPFVYVRTSANSTASPYWGADHGYFTGRPQDGDKVTIVGVYPAGGKYGGGSSAQSSTGTEGEKGAGIMPIILSSYVRFLKAEAYLTVLSNSPSAKIEMDLAINESISKVASLFLSLPQPSTTDVTNYVNYVGSFYTNNANKQLEIIIKEFYIASWGNGIEAYNNYRRTGFPSNMQPALEPYPGNFYTAFYYPSDSQANNPNTPSNIRTRKVFWDINSPTLH